MAIDGEFPGYVCGTCVKLCRGQHPQTPPFVSCILSERPSSLCRHVRGYRSAPLPGQPVLDEADADTRTDAGML